MIATKDIRIGELSVITTKGIFRSLIEQRNKFLRCFLSNTLHFRRWLGVEMAEHEYKKRHETNRRHYRYCLAHEPLNLSIRKRAMIFFTIYRQSA